VIVDGAGIGSAMTANKVPGVRAANCWNEASARNAREHNLANVLTLGGRMFTRGELHATLRAFLATPWGGDRHARRVAKITELENRWTRARRD
jgi:ribose 5-phosphate isomerase B